MLDIRVTDLIVAYLSAAVAPALVVFVTERSALNDLKAKCDTLWYNIKIILIKECNYPRGDYVFALTVGVIYIIMIVAGTPSGELKRRVSLFESSINTLTASCKRSSKEHN